MDPSRRIRVLITEILQLLRELSYEVDAQDEIIQELREKLEEESRRQTDRSRP